MNKWHDIVDWVGGYPFEVAKPDVVFDRCRQQGLELIRLSTVGGSLARNEFLFARAGGPLSERWPGLARRRQGRPIRTTVTPSWSQM